MPKTSRLVYAIKAREVTPGIKDPIDWNLLSTWPVTDFNSAVHVIWWYQCRWMIEEVFRVLKQECFNIEASELEQGWAIRKLTLMILDTVIKLFQMQISYMEEEDISAESIFEQEEIACLESLGGKLEGKTTKLSNPNSKGSLKRLTWIVARLGGWKGYKSQRDFGITTLINGLEMFFNAFEGWTLARDVGTR